MNQAYHIAELSRNLAVFQSLLSGLSKEEYQWRWQEDKWCLQEIVCHLYDEEREDFRQRTKSVLEDPSRQLPLFDPTAWVKDRDYMGQQYEKVLQNFLKERRTSIDWLESLSDPKWDNAFQHHKLGPLSAGFFLSNWVANDYLHIRQILNLKYMYLKEATGYRLDYAGHW